MLQESKLSLTVMIVRKKFVRLRVFRALDGHSDESAPYNPC